jgi:hypothetical protein
MEALPSNVGNQAPSAEMPVASEALVPARSIDRLDPGLPANGLDTIRVGPRGPEVALVPPLPPPPCSSDGRLFADVVRCKASVQTNVESPQSVDRSVSARRQFSPGISPSRQQFVTLTEVELLTPHQRHGAL